MAITIPGQKVRGVGRLLPLLGLSGREYGTATATAASGLLALWSEDAVGIKSYFENAGAVEYSNSVAKRSRCSHQGRHTHTALGRVKQGGIPPPWAYHCGHKQTTRHETSR